MARKRYIGLKGTIDVALTNSGTTMSSPELADLPAIASPDIAAIILDPTMVGGDPEVVYVTAHTALATTATITRGQETAYLGSVGRSHLINTRWYQAPTPVDHLEVPGAEGYVAGNYYGPPGAAATTRSMALGLLNVAPFLIREPRTFDRVLAEVTATSAANGVIRLGLWNHNPLTGLPGTLLLDAGTILGTSATVQSVTINQLIPAGTIWIGAATQVAGTPTMRAFSGGLPLVPTHPTTPIANTGTCVAVASVTGAFGTLVGASFVLNVVTCPMLMLRAA